MHCACVKCIQNFCCNTWPEKTRVYGWEDNIKRDFKGRVSAGKLTEFIWLMLVQWLTPVNMAKNGQFLTNGRCMCVCVCVCMYVCVRACVWMDGCMHVCGCMDGCMDACMYVRPLFKIIRPLAMGCFCLILIKCVISNGEIILPARNLANKLCDRSIDRFVDSLAI
jgi:hypothetical protein